MKQFFLTALLCIGIATSTVHAQFLADQSDTLYVYSQEKLYAKLVAPSVLVLQRSSDWKDLIMAFRENLESIQTQIPDYLIYDIQYYKNVNLQVEEVEGVVQYEVINGIATMGLNQSRASLRDETISVSLYFNEIEDLFEEEYITMIKKAVVKVKKVPSGIREDYYYSYSKGEMIERPGKLPLNKRFAFTFNPSVSLYNNRPLYEWGGGFGFFSGKNKNRFIYFSLDQLFQYDEQTRTNHSGMAFSLSYKLSKYGSLNLALPFEGEHFAENFYLRLGATIYPTKGLSISTYFFVPKKSISFVGIGIGYAP